MLVSSASCLCINIVSVVRYVYETCTTTTTVCSIDVLIFDERGARSEEEKVGRHKRRFIFPRGY